MTTATIDRAPRRFRPSDECLALLPEALNAEHVSVWSGESWDRELLFTLDTETGVAEVAASGPLDPRASWYWDGYAGPAGIEARLRAALLDARVRAVVLRLDSPGGAVSGLFECCDAVRAAKASTGKPVVAFAEGQGAFSAAYALAATADEIVCSRTAGVGSVGVIATAVSYADALTKEGIAVAVVASGAQKSDLHPALPLAEAAVKRLRGRVMELAGLFFAEVAASRRMSADDVRELQAGCFYGDGAVASGLADRVGTSSDASARARALADERAVKAAQEKHMGALHEALGLSAEATDGDVEREVAALAVFARAVTDATGHSDRAAALGAVRAMVASAPRHEAAARRLAELEARLTSDEEARMLAEARASGAVTPADEASEAWQRMHSLARADGIDSLRAFFATQKPRVPTVPRVPAGPGAQTTEALTDEEREFARRAGLTHEEFLAQKRADAAAQKGSL